MSPSTDGGVWTTRIVRDSAFRRLQLRRAGLIEAVFSLAAAAMAIVAVWGYTAGNSVVGGIGAATVGGFATLSFAATMAIAAGGGIRRRLILLVIELSGPALPDSRRSSDRVAEA